MLRLLRRLIPKPLLRIYHAILSLLGAALFRFPSRKLIVIGVTGTKGKSTVANLIEYLLRSQGHAVGLASTPLLAIAGKRWTNEAKMTMLGRLALQRLLRRMVQAGCQYVVIEMTSEGLAQHRALGIDVDIAVFTNLTPEHLESHGSFAAYRAAKGKLFRTLSGRRKQVADRRIPKISVMNADDPQVNFYASFPADERIFYRTSERDTVDLVPRATVLTATNVKTERDGVRFRIGKLAFRLPFLGTFSASNALAAMAVAQTQGVTLEAMRTLLAAAPTVPGRLEFINRGQPFHVVVDYAHEPVSLASFYDAIASTKPKRLLCVLGATGGGRDRGKRPILGQVAAAHCDLVYVTDEDPYDDDPRQIMEEVAAGAIRAGLERGRTLHVIPDRAEAIHQAVADAKPRDAVVITGKGNEPWMVVKGGKKIPWNDRQIARDAIKAVLSNSEVPGA
ncbi:MAG: UDP-N-acetylmuramoyl-L-alanyl-D-glutamate--2,6-diaminopimelate ligase [Candidatus Kerfeldbacteria bacterium]|nr:UDP-N-acetylmuramoyl-L-alanyl-D-glutamate--2,6-diaminopimelate ligase [Candidatus Kerfeldbacteria bacterium]